MEYDFLKSLEYLGITARIKRLSDNLASGIKDLYKENNFDIEPSWHLIFLYLKENKQSTMSELATAFHYSQPATTKMITRMKAKGYIDVKSDSSDSRKKILLLSTRAKKMLPKFEKVWDAGQKSVQEILKANTKFIADLEQFENEIKNESFKERATRKLNKKKQRSNNK